MYSESDTYVYNTTPIPYLIQIEFDRTQQYIIFPRLEQDIFRQRCPSMCFQVLNLAIYKSDYVLIIKIKKDTMFVQLYIYLYKTGFWCVSKGDPVIAC